MTDTSPLQIEPEEQQNLVSPRANQMIAALRVAPSLGLKREELKDDTKPLTLDEVSQKLSLQFNVVLLDGRSKNADREADASE